MRYNIAAIEKNFPSDKVSELALHESWRKEICRPIYYIHKWWARRLGSIFRAIILGSLSGSDIDIWENFYKFGSLKGKVVLDPFMGSGVTVGETIKLGAMAIGCDINPVSSFMVRQEFVQINEKRLKEAYFTLEKNVAPQIQHYYTTEDPDTGELIPVLYYFWIMTVSLPSGEVIPLFTRYVFAQNARPAVKPKAWICCPQCFGIFSDRYDRMETKCPNCGNIFNPQQGPAKGQYVFAGNKKYKIKELIHSTVKSPQRKMYALLALKKNGEKIYLSPTHQDHKLYEEASEQLKNEILPLPKMRVRSGYNTNQAISYNYREWRDFFNDRQLLCLGLLLKGIMNIPDTKIREQMLCLFSGTLEFNNMFCSFKGEGTGATRHMFSNHILKPEKAALENSIWGTRKSSGTFSTLFESRLMRARNYLKEPFEIAFESSQNSLLEAYETKKKPSQKRIVSRPITVPIFDEWKDLVAAGEGTLILNGDSSHLAIPDNSVDAIITDPPYFDFINYSELSDFFFAWLSPVLKDHYNWMNRKNCFDPGEVQNSDSEEFIKRLTDVFKEGNRVLKEDGILAFSFHHSRPEGWIAIYKALINADFRITATYPVHSEMRGSTPLSAAKDPISVDAIIVCRKNNYLSFNNSPQSAYTHMIKLQNKGLKLSKSDIFVIKAAVTLLNSSLMGKTYKDVTSALAKI